MPRVTNNETRWRTGDGLRKLVGAVVTQFTGAKLLPGAALTQELVQLNSLYDCVFL